MDRDTVRVVIADRHRSFADALGSRLSGEPDIEVVGRASSVEELGAAVVSADPDLILVDVELRSDDRERFAELVSRPRPLTLIVRTDDSLAMAFWALQRGAVGVVDKMASYSALVAAIRATAEGVSAVPGDLLAGFVSLLGSVDRRLPVELRDEALDTLTDREREVLQLLVDGFEGSMIAEHLFISGHTVRTHVRRVLAKLGVHSRVEAVSVALRSGLRPRPVDGGEDGAEPSESS